MAYSATAVELAEWPTDYKDDRQFYQAVDRIKRTFNDATQKIGTISQLGASAVDWQAQRRSKSSDEAVKVAAECKASLREVGDQLKRMGAVLPRSTPQDQLDPETRSRVVIHSSLSKTLLDLMQKLQHSQMATDESQRRVLAGQLRMIDCSLSDAQINEAINAGELDSVLQQSLFESGRSAEVNSAYIIARQRHTEIQQLERSIAELHQLMIDFNVLLDSQSQLIDSIETNVAKARDDTSKAVVNLEKAANSQRRSRCITIIIIIAAVVAILVVGGILLGIFL